MAPAPDETVSIDDTIRDEPVYEPPMLVEVGGFAEVTHGPNLMMYSDFPSMGYSHLPW